LIQCLILDELVIYNFNFNYFKTGKVLYNYFKYLYYINCLIFPIKVVYNLRFLAINSFVCLCLEKYVESIWYWQQQAIKLLKCIFCDQFKKFIFLKIKYIRSSIPWFISHLRHWILWRRKTPTRLWYPNVRRQCIHKNCIVLSSSLKIILKKFM